MSFSSRLVWIILLLSRELAFQQYDVKAGPYSLHCFVTVAPFHRKAASSPYFDNSLRVYDSGRC